MTEVKNVLVVGSWAKEQITIEHIKHRENLKVFGYLDTRNPGITAVADGYHIGKFSDVAEMVRFAREIRADLVLPTTAEPLAAGLANALAKEKIPVFGPDQEAARLENDKAFTRRLMKNHGIDAIPEFEVFRRAEPALKYAKDLDWEVAVKPVGLTDGLGVKVTGDQLNDEADVKNYIREILTRRISGHAAVIVEEKLSGVEFTLQCLVAEDRVLPTPIVQDFKKLYAGEKGPNTASMGSYSHQDPLLPFITRYDYEKALRVIKETLQAYGRDTGGICRGFLYGQFMLTPKGLKLIEYNFRPGDPEWMDVMFRMESGLCQTIQSLMAGEIPKVQFSRQATVCKYVVPETYPHKLNEPLNVTVNEDAVKRFGVDYYYSCGVDDKGVLRVGSERGIAFLAGGDTINDAYAKVEKAIKATEGEFYYRSDIGTPGLLLKKIKQVRKINKQRTRFRSASSDDFLPIADFAAACPPLEPYPMHIYKIMFRYFGETCLVMELDGDLAGFVLGFLSQKHDHRYFLWQIGVDPRLQGSGIGKKVLTELEKRLRRKQVKRIELTVDLENIPSRKLFEALGYDNISGRETTPVVVDGVKAVKDFYGPERHFILYGKNIS